MTIIKVVKRLNMKKLSNTTTIFFDVDDTLVMWPKGSHIAPEEEKDYIVIKDAFGNVLVKPSKIHIEALKMHKNQGQNIVVWSQGGSDWAEAVVKALGLEEFVDLVICKPRKFYDDFPASHFMTEADRIYLEDID